MNNFDLQRRIKKVPVKDKKGKKRNLVFSGLLLLAISFSIVTVIGAATPDPGHSFAELDLTGILIGPTEGGTGLTTIGLPDQVLGVNLAGTGLEYKTIDKTFIGLPNVEDTALSTWFGTSNISTLGTITSGIWNANPIGDTHISSAGTWNAKQNALGFTPENSSNKGIPGGYAELDGSGAIPTSQIPVSILGKVEYKGTWDANTNVPDLVLGTSVKGDYYIVSVTGVTSLGGITDWQIGDWAIYDGTTWGKVENTDSVTSVNGGTGAIIVDPTSLGLVIGTDVQAWDADLDSWSAIAPASKENTISVGTITQYFRGDKTWVKLPVVKSGRIIARHRTPVSIVFTTPFTSTPNCTCSLDLSGTGGSIRGYCYFTATGSPTTTGFTAELELGGGGFSPVESMQWMCTDADNT